MKITYQDFESYISVQESGITNMFDTKIVCKFSGLSRTKVLFIMENYHDLLLDYKNKVL